MSCPDVFHACPALMQPTVQPKAGFLSSMFVNVLRLFME